ncbi:MAG: translocation/assembly module TamB domain-containing protein, partial [Muribaculaceae bacterium]|nr:translocation/assembly module TamB domain-containing protein [Muribaculaceae bacterium]
VMTCLLLAIVVPALLYVALSLPWIQNMIRVRCENMLTEKLGVEVTIGDLGIRPFNRATVRELAIVNKGDTLLVADRVGAGINIYELLLHGNIAIDYAELTGLDMRLRRATPDAPLNIQPIIDALAGKDEKKEPTKFDLRVNTVVIRRTSISYDVESESAAQPGIFDSNHVDISNLRADLNIPRLSNDDIRINLKRLAFSERSGLDITDMRSIFYYSNEAIGWENMAITMPGSLIEPYDIKESLASLGGIASGLSSRMLPIGIKPGSHVSLTDIAPLVPTLKGFDSTIDFSFELEAARDRINIRDVSISDTGGQLTLMLNDGVINHPLDTEQFGYKIDDISLRIGGQLYSSLADSNLPILKAINLPRGLTMKGTAEGNMHAGRAETSLTLDNGTMEAHIAYSKPADSAPLSAKFNISAEGIDLAEALGRSDLGTLNADIKGSATLAGRRTSAVLEADVTDFTYRGHTYDRLSATMNYTSGAFDGKALLDDNAGKIAIDFSGDSTPGDESIDFYASLDDVDLHELNLSDRFAGYTLNATIDGSLTGLLPDRVDGTVDITDFALTAPESKSLKLDNISLIFSTLSVPRSIELQSDIINGDITGDFRFSTLMPALRALAFEALPALSANLPKSNPVMLSDLEGNDFTFSFTLDDLDRISDFFNLPVYAIYPIEIEGSINERNSQASIDIDAPYMRHGNKLIEGTRLSALIDGTDGTDRAVLNTSYPSKDGMTAITVALQATHNVIDTDINWKIDRERDYSGAVSLSTLIEQSDKGLTTFTDLHESKMAFNDSVWTLSPALIVTDGSSRIDITGINVSRENQFVKINGTVSDDPDDVLDIDVRNLSLDYIFEAIGIDKVMLGGDATGRLTASELLTPAPHLSTEGIHVTDISYNRCVLGDADVLSWWDNDMKAVAIDGTIHQANGRTAKVEGEIFPLSSSLDIRLLPDETPVGFMEEYMKAFASDISGEGSGWARIYGTFSDIDMEGRIYAKNLRLKLDFTNTYFTASDSIIITPGRINLRDVTLSDPYGNTATLNGTVTHEFFRNPTFDFSITDARGMLVYDETPKQNADWYGKIFVNGGASINGEPGVVKIDVEATTTSGSTFSFVLSELEIADEYTFLTFRDKDAVEEEEVKIDERLGAVEHLRAMLNKPVDEESSDYIIELRVNITPEAEIILVMDPVGGDRIRSHGQGNLRMVYTSADNDLRMFGTYTLDSGTYNFTLQDIIIKDFIINSGSQIAFTGDPLTARLNIEAIYPLNANLSDLDESFLQDKELNRTNVPVHAVLKVTGDIQEPEIKFDLAFPTLTSDTYRKVKSIVSTEEMMNRQIIYLLALNRFYTPDYMTSTTKGNELFSVASSTISSQLSNILGHLSDNWTVSPNFRSDRGDFSDMEVDVALSSRLLNNRLLFNGNLGYRDNLMNSNQFIGDFQIEYLLNRTGTIRLKAYNFYNDQNYYLRTADTTQGVGVMFKKDFDNFFSFLRRRKKDAKNNTAENTDIPADSIPADTVTAVAPLPPVSEADSIICQQNNMNLSKPDIK